MKVSIFIEGQPEIKDVSIVKLKRGVTDLFFDHKIYTGFQYDGSDRITSFKPEYLTLQRFNGYAKIKKTKEWVDCFIKVTEL